jgi:hypothetical protein
LAVKPSCPKQDFVAEAPVEKLHEAILPGAASLDVDRLDLLVGEPALGLFGDKLRAVVGADLLGRPVLAQTDSSSGSNQRNQVRS